MHSNYLQNLRSKPEPVRRRIAVITSAVLTALIVGIWLINNSITSSAPQVTTSASPFSLSDTVERIRVGFSVVLESLRNHLP